MFPMVVSAIAVLTPHEAPPDTPAPLLALGIGGEGGARTSFLVHCSSDGAMAPGGDTVDYGNPYCLGFPAHLPDSLALRFFQPSAQGLTQGFPAGTLTSFPSTI